jgi:hypothetical protein
MRPRSIAAVLGFLLAAPLHADDVYRWVDARGGVGYGEKPPVGAHSVRRLSIDSGNVSVIPTVRPRALPAPEPRVADAAAPSVVVAVPVDAARLERWREQCFAERRVDCDRPTAATFDMISSTSPFSLPR